MIKTIFELSAMSMGLIPLMALLFLVSLAVIIERAYFFHKVLSAGHAMERELRLSDHRGADVLEEVANRHEGALQSTIITTALAMQEEDRETLSGHIDEAILWQLPRMDKHMWVLDTAVTLGPLLGLLGTIIGMVKTFNMFGAQGTSGAPQVVTGGIGEALVATGAGLVIAIIGLVFLNHFNKRVRVGLHQMELLKVMVINRLLGRAGKGLPSRESHHAKVAELAVAGSGT
jgi:biopolymer transport protein ExbB